ncbi:MAG: hypothetical protein IIA61_02455 [Candidatus Marinimicrobia bacterium]|nr:hypothetical protein [Candidatus Neomarinimicrobiota bacterium]
MALRPDSLTVVALVGLDRVSSGDGNDVVDHSNCSSRSGLISKAINMTKGIQSSSFLLLIIIVFLSSFSSNNFTSFLIFLDNG